MTEFEFTDRYQALGIPYPDPKTMCLGDCEGTGRIPIYMRTGDKKRSVYPNDETNPTYITLWTEAEKKSPADDGYHFIKCPKCNGTGKKKNL